MQGARRGDLMNLEWEGDLEEVICTLGSER